MVYDSHRARPVVVVFGPGKAEVRRRVELVELPDRPDAAERRGTEPSRPVPCLPAHAALEILHEVPLVLPVARAFEREDALADFDDRRNGADALQCRRWPAAVLPCELQREVAAKRVAGDDD